MSVGKLPSESAPKPVITEAQAEARGARAAAEVQKLSAVGREALLTGGQIGDAVSVEVGAEQVARKLSDGDGWSLHRQRRNDGVHAGPIR